MKAYTLRLEDQFLSTLKELGIKEKKSVRQIILEALHNRVNTRVSSAKELKERKMLERAAVLASRLPIEEVVKSIREDRQR